MPLCGHLARAQSSWTRFVALASLFAGLTCLTGCSAAHPTASGTPAAESPAPAVPSGQRLVFTYYFYWYDSTTGGHLQPQLMQDRFPQSPAPSWRSQVWQMKQLRDMSAAGIDTALAVYWGFDRPQDTWSSQGLAVMGRAYRSLKAAGQAPPRIGLFLDTSIVGMRDLTTDAGKRWFYAQFKDFFTRVPRDAWQLVNGRPVAFLFTSDFTKAVNQSTFDYVYDRFNADFKVKPYIVREVSWDYPILRWNGNERVRDYTHPIRTDNSYLWAAAIHGFVNRGGVAAVGPGFDDRLVPGRNPVVTDRKNGDFYAKAWKDAINSGKNLVAIETWDEMHEGSDVCESIEFGRKYIDITRHYADLFHKGG
jgi:hypothetical protein